MNTFVCVSELVCLFVFMFVCGVQVNEYCGKCVFSCFCLFL